MTQQYDYFENVKNDVIDFIKDNEINVNEVDREELNEQLWIEDSVTGNGSGSYTFNANKAKEYVDDNKQGIIRVFLKYGNDGQRVISGLKRISKPGLRTYVKSDAVPKVLNGLGIAIISTSEGVVTDKVARAKKIGGEVIAYVW